MMRGFMEWARQNPYWRMGMIALVLLSFFVAYVGTWAISVYVFEDGQKWDNVTKLRSGIDPETYLVNTRPLVETFKMALGICLWLALLAGLVLFITFQLCDGYSTTRKIVKIQAQVIHDQLTLRAERLLPARVMRDDEDG